MRHFAAVGRGALLTAGMVLAGAAGAGAQQLVDGGRGIEVSGVGQVEVQPDEATLYFAVETSAPTSDEAARQNAETMERVIAALGTAGIPRDVIETRNFSVYPEYVHDAQGENPRIRGYRVSNQVSLKTGELERIGALIDTALGAGANRMDGLNFGLSDRTAAEQEALRLAVQEARATASTLAEALGVPLGPVLYATTSGDPVRPVLRARGMELQSVVADTPIQPGQQTVEARVVLVFGLGG